MNPQTTDTLAQDATLQQDTAVSSTIVNDSPAVAMPDSPVAASDTFREPPPAPAKPVNPQPSKPAITTDPTLAAWPQDTLQTGKDSSVVTSVAPASETDYVAFAKEQFRPRNVMTWEILVLLSVVFIIAFIKAFRQRRFELLFKAFVNSRWVPQNIREENTFTNQAIILLNIGFVLIMALFILKLLEHWPLSGEIDEVPFFLKTVVLILLIYITKFSVLEILAEIVDQRQAVQEYIFNVMIFNLFIGIGLLPILLGNAMTLNLGKPLLMSAIALLALVYLYRNWRAIKISITYRFPVYYIFLYLCTLEILPSIVLLKLIKAQLI